MTTTTMLNIVSSSVGFCAAIFFCIGNALNSSNQIITQASTYWDFNVSLARSLAAQRAQYVIGALLLVVSFFLQVAASLIPSTTPANIPQYVHTGPYLVLVVLLSTLCLAGACSFVIYKNTDEKIILHMKKIKEESLLPP